MAKPVPFNELSAVLDPHDRVRIAASADVHPDSVRKWATGSQQMRGGTRRRIEAAARKLGFIE